jgi:hypothetical protein
VNEPKPKAKRSTLHQKYSAAQRRIAQLEAELRKQKALLADTNQSLRQLLRERRAEKGSAAT